jgi:hypothetical protein
LQLREALTRHVKADLHPDALSLMRELEPHDGVWSDQAIAAHLPVEADIERKGAQTVVAVSDANERPEGVRSLARPRVSKIE